jgi:hypothetical protein
MFTRVSLLVGFLCLIAGVALGGAAAYTWMRPGKPASTPAPPEAVDGSVVNTTKTPVFELKTKPSPVANEFDFRALLDKVAGPVLRPGNYPRGKQTENVMHARPGWITTKQRALAGESYGNGNTSFVCHRLSSWRLMICFR